MTTVFPPNGNVDATSAGTHVLIIGVGGYPHLLGGDPKRLVDDPMGLEQLSSPPASAQALAEWFAGRQAYPEAKHGFHNPKAPLASIEMLVSPPWVLEKKAKPHRYPLPDGAGIAIDGATRKRIGTCYASWIKRVGAHPDNIGVFYFCGHGVTGLNDYVLAEDFGQDSNPWRDAIDIVTTARAARRKANGALYFFIDSCRETKQESLTPGSQAQSLEDVKFKKPMQCFSRLMLWATGEGQLAHGAEGKPSRFTSAVIQALSGFYGEPSPEGQGWFVSGIGLASAIDQLLEQENTTLAAHLHQHMEVDLIGSEPFHYESVQPQTVATTVSIAYVNPEVRGLLEKLPGAETLPPMVKEAIAEDVESGRITVQQLQQEVDQWSQDISAWASRFAAEPDREVAEKAGALLAAGKLDEAGVLFDQLIRLAEERAIAEDARLASYYASRADVLGLQMKWRESVPFLEKAIASTKQAHGDTPHPDLAIALSKLGGVWDQLGEYRKAIDYFSKALTMTKEVHGDTPHPDVARELNNLGGAWHQIGEYDKAIDYFSDALSVAKQVYGDTPHQDVARDLNNLGLAWRRLGKYHEAIDYYTEALAMDRKVYGKTPHPDVVIDLNNLGEAWRRLGQYHKAIDYFTEALAMDRKVYGETLHPAVAITLNNLGLAWYQLSKYHKAIDCYTCSLAIAKKVYGDTPHPALAITLNNLGGAWRQLGDYHKAIAYHTDALAMDRKVYGETPHPDVARVLDNLGEAWRRLGDYHKAIAYHTDALTMDRKVYGDAPHPDVASVLNNLGEAWYRLGDSKKAIDYYTDALAMDEIVYGDDPHPNVARVLNNLGEAWRQLGEFDKAIDCFTPALEMLEATLPKDHPDLQSVRANLATD